MVLWGYEICRKDIPTYFTERAMAAIDLWQTYKLFGFPFSGGWAEQPAVYMDIIKALEIEARKRQGKHAGK